MGKLANFLDNWFWFKSKGVNFFWLVSSSFFLVWSIFIGPVWLVPLHAVFLLEAAIGVYWIPRVQRAKDAWYSDISP